MGLHKVRRNALKSEGCESRANIGNIARVSQMSHECRKLWGASDELGSDMGDCLQLILTQYEPNGNCVPTPLRLELPLVILHVLPHSALRTCHKSSQVSLRTSTYLRHTAHLSGTAFLSRTSISALHN